MGFLGVLLKVVGYLPALIMGVENLHGPKTGEVKRNTVIEMVGLLLSMTSGAGGNVQDNEKFQEGLREVINGTVKMLNASVLHKS